MSIKERGSSYQFGFLKGSIKVMSVALSFHCRKNNIYLPPDVAEAVDKISEEILELCERGDI